MTATTTTAPRLSDEQVAEALALMKDSDSVELKLTVGEDQHRSTAMALGMDPLKLRFAPEELRRRVVAEMWLYPDGSRILELSTGCATTEAFQVAAEARAFLASRGVDLSAEQATKTRKALAFFAGPAAAGGP